MSLPSDRGDRDPRPDGPSDAEIDRRFAELTADFGSVPAPSNPAPEVPVTTTGGPRDYALPEELDEAFVPPEPEPLTSANPHLALAWLGAVGGPIAFIVLLLTWPRAPGLVWLTALLAMLAGWAVIIWKLPRTRSSSDDDGAVV